MSSISSQVLLNANEVATKIGLKFPVKPITDWKRATFSKRIANLDFILIDKLTFVESAVIDYYRGQYRQEHVHTQIEGQKLLVELGELLGVEEQEELLKLIQDKDALLANFQGDPSSLQIKMLELKKIQSFTESTTIKQQNLVIEMLTFFIAMRANHNWDYEDTFQLDEEEQNAILDLLLLEESKESSFVPDSSEPTTLKKS